jgi:hypothetical protein
MTSNSGTTNVQKTGEITLGNREIREAYKNTIRTLAKDELLGLASQCMVSDNNQPDTTKPPTPATSSQTRSVSDGDVILFKTTRFELQHLAQYWASIRLDYYLTTFATGTCGGSERRRAQYANSRLDQLAETLGADAVQAAENEVADEERKKVGPEYWRVYTQGSNDERRERVETNFAVLDDLYHRCDDEATKAKAWAYLSINPSKFFVDDEGFLWSMVRDKWSHDQTEDQLVLRLASSIGGAVLVPDCKMQRPADWSAPYGLK